MWWTPQARAMRSWAVFRMRCCKDGTCSALGLLPMPVRRCAAPGLARAPCRSARKFLRSLYPRARLARQPSELRENKELHVYTANIRRRAGDDYNHGDLLGVVGEYL